MCISGQTSSTFSKTLVFENVDDGSIGLDDVKDSVHPIIVEQRCEGLEDQQGLLSTRFARKGELAVGKGCLTLLLDFGHGCVGLERITDGKLSNGITSGRIAAFSVGTLSRPCSETIRWEWDPLADVDPLEVSKGLEEGIDKPSLP